MMISFKMTLFRGPVARSNNQNDTKLSMKINDDMGSRVSQKK